MQKKIIYTLYVLVVLSLLVTLSQVHRDIPLERLKPAYASLPSKFINIDGTVVHYRDEGNGFPVILIHGMSSSLHTWQGWADILSKQYRVIRMDLPAFGLTGPSAKNDYSADGYVNFVQKFLDSLDIKECYMAGNSLGGKITWQYTLTHPQQVKKIILVDAAGYPMANPPFIFSMAKSKLASSVMRYVTPRMIVEKSMHEVYGDPSKVTDSAVQRYFDLALRAGNRAAFISFVNQFQLPDTTLIKQIHTPTLIMWGEKDRWIPLAHGNSFARDIAGSKLIVYPGLGHIPMEEDAALTCKDALNFFAGTGAETTLK